MAPPSVLRSTASGSPASSSVAPALPPPGGPQWINVTDAAANASPPATYESSMAYDPVDQLTVYFGGCGNTVCPDNQTWAFANGHWANLTDPFHAPPARRYGSMVYDPNMGGLLLFGGLGVTVALNDTWLFRDGLWTNLTWIGKAPPARYGAGMTFDPSPEENGTILFGGIVSGIGYWNDTWIWQGWSGWSPLVTSFSPAPSGFGGMAYDPADGAVVLYRPDTVNETWELYSGQWWLVNVPGPGYHFAPSMTYDPELSAVVLFGGVTLGGFVSDTWTFAGGSWQELFPSTPPAARAAPGLSLDATGSVPILFGGLNTTIIFGDTWAFEGPPSATLAAAAPTPETSAPISFTVTLASGTAPYHVSMDFGDHTGAAATTATTTVTFSHAYDAPGSFAPSVNVTDAVGAATAASAPSLVIAAGPAIAASAHPAEVDVGSAIALSSHMVSPGIGSVTFTWSLSDGTALSGANVSHAFSTPGAFPETVTAVDGVGGTANATVWVHVNALPSASIVVATLSPTSGYPVLFTANVSGGTAPYRYAWSFGDGSTSSFAAPAHSFNGTRSYTVDVWVNDSSGGSTHATVTVDVASVTASSAGAPLWFWAGLVGLIALGAVGAALVLLRSRGGRPPKPTTSKGDGPPENGPTAEAQQKPQFPEDEL